MESKYIAEREKLIIDTGTTINFIDADKIILCQQVNEYLIFRMIDEPYVEIQFNFDELTELLSNSTFVRVSDNYLINLKYLEHIPNPDSLFIEMEHNLRVPVDMLCKKTIMEALENRNNS